MGKTTFWLEFSKAFETILVITQRSYLNEESDDCETVRFLHRSVQTSVLPVVKHEMDLQRLIGANCNAHI